MPLRGFIRILWSGRYEVAPEEGEVVGGAAGAVLGVLSGEPQNASPLSSLKFVVQNMRARDG